MWLQELLFYCYRKRRKYDKIKIIINLYLKEQVNYCELAFFFFIESQLLRVEEAVPRHKEILTYFLDKTKVFSGKSEISGNGELVEIKWEKGICAPSLSLRLGLTNCSFRNDEVNITFR